MSQHDNLPALPYSAVQMAIPSAGMELGYLYTADQMREYAVQALDARRASLLNEMRPVFQAAAEAAVADYLRGETQRMLYGEAADLPTSGTVMTGPAEGDRSNV